MSSTSVIHFTRNTSNPNLPNNKMTITFPMVIALGRNDRIALSSLVLPYSWPNIDAKQFQNATMQYVMPNNSNTYTINFSSGNYSIDDINAYIHSAMKADGNFLLDQNGAEQYFINCWLDAVHYKIVFEFVPVPSSLPSGWTNSTNMPLSPNQAIPGIGFGGSKMNQTLGFSAITPAKIVTVADVNNYSTPTANTTAALFDGNPTTYWNPQDNGTYHTNYQVDFSLDKTTTITAITLTTPAGDTDHVPASFNFSAGMGNPSNQLFTITQSNTTVGQVSRDTYVLNTAFTGDAFNLIFNMTSGFQCYINEVEIVQSSFYPSNYLQRSASTVYLASDVESDMNPVIGTHVCIDAIENSLNAIPSDSIYFTVADASAGNYIVEKPTYLQYFNARAGMYKQLTLTLRDDQGQDMNLQDGRWTATIRIQAERSPSS